MDRVTFGDNRALCDALLALVRAERKTATCNRLELFGDGGEPLPEPGRRDVALDWDGNPAVTIETLTTRCIRYCDVAEDLALAAGENDDLDGWRRDHRAYFERNGGWHPEMWLLFETFRMVEDLVRPARG
jgi:uncharacterized protein YhfF